MLTNRQRWVVAGLAIALVAAPVGAHAEGGGDLDLSFGRNGIASTSGFAEFDRLGGHRLALQSDGKIILVGETEPASGVVMAARFGADGSPDSTFGEAGVVMTPVHNLEHVRSVALQSDGKILVGGTTYNGWDPDQTFLVRYNAAGALDTTFSGDGIIAAEGTDPGPVVTGITMDIVADPDDRTVLLADSFGGLTLVRYAVDGSPDPTFGVDGVVQTRVGDLGWPEGQWLVPNAMTMQADGSVVVVGSRWLDNTFEYADLVVLRYEADGALDTAFGGDGVATVDRSSGDHGYSVAMQPDGKIVVTGQRLAGGGRLLVTRFNPDGSLDTAFGDGGVVTSSDVDPTVEAGAFVQARPSGGILVVSSRTSDAAVLRLNDDGWPDLEFGDNGIVAISFGDQSIDAGLAVAVQTDDSILVGGASRSGETDPRWFLAVARLRSAADSVPPTTEQPVTTLPATGRSVGTGKVALAYLALVIGVAMTCVARRRPAWSPRGQPVDGERHALRDR